MDGIAVRAYFRFVGVVSALKDLPPLIFRLILAYGFYEPAIQKLNNFNSIIDWFRDVLKLPFPEINAVLAVATENIGFVLLALGLATRLISIPLMIVMVVAITTVHLQHGFPCGKNGFEIPFYYFFMLLSLVVTGAGKFSLDYLISKLSLGRKDEKK